MTGPDWFDNLLLSCLGVPCGFLNWRAKQNQWDGTGPSFECHECDGLGQHPALGVSCGNCRGWGRMPDRFTAAQSETDGMLQRHGSAMGPGEGYMGNVGCCWPRDRGSCRRPQMTGSRGRGKM